MIHAKQWKTLNNSRHLVVQTAQLFRSTMEHFYGILLDQKFLRRCVHASFVNTKWYEAWLDDQRRPGKAHRHWSTHTCCSVFVGLLVSQVYGSRSRLHAFWIAFSTASQPELPRKISRWSQFFFTRLCLPSALTTRLLVSLQQPWRRNCL